MGRLPPSALRVHVSHRERERDRERERGLIPGTPTETLTESDENDRTPQQRKSLDVSPMPGDSPPSPAIAESLSLTGSDALTRSSTGTNTGTTPKTDSLTASVTAMRASPNAVKLQMSAEASTPLSAAAASVPPSPSANPATSPLASAGRSVLQQEVLSHYRVTRNVARQQSTRHGLVTAKRSSIEYRQPSEAEAPVSPISANPSPRLTLSPADALVIAAEAKAHAQQTRRSKGSPRTPLNVQPASSSPRTPVSPAASDAQTDTATDTATAALLPEPPSQDDAGAAPT